MCTALDVFISLLFDDRAWYKLVRFKCAVPTASTTDPVASQGMTAPAASHGTTDPATSQGTTDPAASQGGESPPAGSSRQVAVKGLLGCFQCLHGSTLDEFADDYARRACHEILEVLKRFCTPLGDAFDVPLCNQRLKQATLSKRFDHSEFCFFAMYI